MRLPSSLATLALWRRNPHADAGALRAQPLGIARSRRARTGLSTVTLALVACARASSERTPNGASLVTRTAATDPGGSGGASGRTLIGEYIGTWDVESGQLSIVPATGPNPALGLTGEAVTWGLAGSKLLTVATVGVTYTDGTTTKSSGTPPSSCSVDTAANNCGASGTSACASAICATVSLAEAASGTFTGADIQVVGLTTGYTVEADDAPLTTPETTAGASSSLGFWRWTRLVPGGSATNGATTWQFDTSTAGQSLNFGIKAWASGGSATPIWPQSGSRVSTRTPTFKWAQAVYGAQTLKICKDHALSSSCVTTTLSDTATTYSATTLAAGHWFWNLTVTPASGGSVSTPTWEFVVPASSTTTAGTSGGTVLDLNGDGYEDLVISEPGYTNKGRIDVYYGSSAGSITLTSPSLTITGSTTGGLFGQSLSSAGDVNGDGYVDLLVGAPGEASGAGHVYVYEGSSSGLSTTPTLTFTGSSTSTALGTTVSGGGDVNGDGYADILAGSDDASSRASVYLWNSSAATIISGSTATETFTDPGAKTGLAISAMLGDANGDGESDFVVWFATSGFLQRSNSATSVTGFLHDGNVAVGSLSSAGDLNGDGYWDLVTMSSTASEIAEYLGSSSGLGSTAEDDGTTFGLSKVAVWGAFDANDDGYSDLLVQKDAQDVELFHGVSGTSGSSTTASTTFNVSWATNLGTTLGATDLAGNGFPSVVLGDPTANAGHGAAYVYSNSAGTVSSTAASATVEGPSAAGTKLTTCDINGDGYVDVVTVDPTARALFLFLGSSTGFQTWPSAAVIDAGSSGDGFGAGLACGVVDGSGDVWAMVSAPTSGIVYEWTYSSSSLQYQGKISVSGASALAIEDVNADSYPDIIVGRPSASELAVYLGASSGALGGSTIAVSAPLLAVGTYNSSWGSVIAAAGDVNGDGYKDIVVGAPLYESSPIAGTKDGAIDVVYGASAFTSSATQSTLYDEGAAGAQYGTSIAGLGDVDGDGCGDLAVGAPGYGSTNTAGYVYLDLGASLSGSKCSHTSDSGFFHYTKTSGNNIGDHLGVSVASGVDINGDGINELFVGTALTGTSGYVYRCVSKTTIDPVYYFTTLRYSDSSYAAGTSPSFGSALATGKDTTGSNKYYFVGAPGWEYSTATTGQIYDYTILSGAGARLIDDLGGLFGTAIAGSSY